MKSIVAYEPLTFRAVLIGLIGTTFLAVATPISDFLINGTWLAACHLPIGVVCVFVLLRYGVSPLLGRVARPLALPEWVVIYSMMLVSAGLTSLGFAAYVVPVLASIPYYATVENDWLALFGQHLPTWIAPFDDNASLRFFEGGDSAVPWGVWWKPLALWTAFSLSLLWAMTCLNGLLRRQWIDRERLSFPLVQLPLELLEPKREAGSSRVVLAMGFALPFAVHGLNGLHVYFPSLPQIPLFFDLGANLNEKPWDVMRPLWLIVHFSAIGFVFLLPVDLSLSLWVFYFVFHGQSMMIELLGLPLGQSTGYSTRGFAAYQMAGGILTLALALLWRARRSFRDLLESARRGVPEEDEPLSPRAMFGGLTLSVAALTGSLMMAGIPLWLSFSVIALFLLTMVAMTRMVAESGLLFIQTPFRPTDLLTPFLGMGGISPRALTALAYPEMVFMFDVRSSPMPSVMDAFKLLDASRLRRRSLVPPVVAASVVAMIVASATVLVIGYRNGAASVSGWFGVGAPGLPFRRLTAWLVDPRSPDPYSVMWIGVGSAMVGLLGVLRARFLWFPFHPIGYAMGPSWPLIQLWFSTFVGWAFKASALRFGGLGTFRWWRPFFLGMVLGEFLSGGMWVVIDFIFGKQGHRIFLF
ncbi:MAG: hypothetical protein O3A46_08580 [Candidatus Poribacteria bacterium]|nr:hypothetical protein [Candidatus Poribacteria bacterium]